MNDVIIIIFCLSQNYQYKFQLQMFARATYIRISTTTLTLITTKSFSQHQRKYGMFLWYRSVIILRIFRDKYVIYICHVKYANFLVPIYG